MSSNGSSYGEGPGIDRIDILDDVILGGFEVYLFTEYDRAIIEENLQDPVTAADTYNDMLEYFVKQHGERLRFKNNILRKLKTAYRQANGNTLNIAKFQRGMKTFVAKFQRRNEIVTKALLEKLDKEADETNIPYEDEFEELAVKHRYKAQRFADQIQASIVELQKKFDDVRIKDSWDDVLFKIYTAIQYEPIVVDE